MEKSALAARPDPVVAGDDLQPLELLREGTIDWSVADQFRILQSTDGCSPLVLDRAGEGRDDPPRSKGGSQCRSVGAELIEFVLQLFEFIER